MRLISKLAIYNTSIAQYLIQRKSNHEIKFGQLIEYN